MKTEAIGRKTVKLGNALVNNTVLVIIILLIAFAGYALWDSQQLHQAADKSHYAIYKPTVKNKGKSFKELQLINEEVFAWLTVYGTNIDYPVTQGQDNMKYVNTNAEGQYSLSGAIFLDHNNSKDFSDFNSILYGHHMARQVMFGEIDEFWDKSKFDEHRYANLYYDGKDHGIEFFAFIHVDAYDSKVFTANVGDDERQAYLDNILAEAIHERDIGVTIDDHIVLLSTCSSDSTNGRDILVGRISDETYDDPTAEAEAIGANINKGANNRDNVVKEIPVWTLLLVLIITALLVTRILDNNIKRERSNKESHAKPFRSRQDRNSETWLTNKNTNPERG